MPTQNGQSQTTRRRSMLPQLSNAKKSPQVHKNNTSPTSLGQQQRLQSEQEPQRTSKDDLMAPPSSVPSFTRASARMISRSTSSTIDPSSNPRSGMSRSTSISGSASVRKPRSASATRNFPSGNKRVPHTRSVSHQVTATPTAPRADRPQATPSDGISSLRAHKPVFNTYKQHYTPSKRALRSSTAPRSGRRFNSASGSPSDNPGSSPPISPPEASVSSPVPTELIHLHYLHSLATPTLTAWSQSAEAHFRTRFSDLCNRSSELHAIAAEQQGLLNALALTEWGAGIPSTLIGEKVETLSRDVGELEGMIRAPDGKFERVREVWEVWVQEAERVRGPRKKALRDVASPGKVDGAGGGFIEGIGDGWKAEAMVLERELGYVKRDLEAFGEVREGSGLGTMVKLAMSLCGGLIEELDVMQWIEDEIMRDEGVWIEEMVGTLGQGLSSGMTL